MWNKKIFDRLVDQLPFVIDVIWDKAPSFEKYGHVNCLLTLMLALHKRGGTFTDVDGRRLKSQTIKPLHRKLTDIKKRWFSIVGLNDVSPFWVYNFENLAFEIYFNYHFFYETETTYRQYFPSASVILRCMNFLQWIFVPSPGSWGSDIAHLTFDWDGTYILEAAPFGVRTAIRKNFKGYKFFPSEFKYMVSAKKIQKTELKFIENNGFKVIVWEEEDPESEKILTDTIDRFLDAQFERYKKFIKSSNKANEADVK